MKATALQVTKSATPAARREAKKAARRARRRAEKRLLMDTPRRHTFGLT